MPFGNFVNLLPPAFFLAVHLAAFSLGAYFAYRAFGTAAETLGWGFSLFAHTIAEVLDLGAFILVFAAAVQTARSGRRAGPVGA